MKIYKNFLNKKDFKNIKDFLSDQYFYWFYENVTSRGLGSKYGQFCFSFILEGGVMNTTKEYMSNFEPLLKKLKYKKLTRLKANCSPRDSKITEHSLHTDQNKGTTGILYINTCNGYTKFENGKKVKSVENTYIEFDSTLKHTGSTCTDTDRRLVLNINYIT